MFFFFLVESLENPEVEDRRGSCCGPFKGLIDGFCVDVFFWCKLLGLVFYLSNQSKGVPNTLVIDGLVRNSDN